MANCYYCGKEISEPRNVGRSSTCPFCGKDLKICRNCTFYDPNAHWECRENIPERVADKERSNFCDYFVFSEKLKSNNKESTQAEKAKENLKKLFGDA